MSGRDHPGVIAPPPLIYLGFLLAGWGLGRLAGLPSIGGDAAARMAVGGLLIGLGLALELWAIGAFRRRRTAVQPWKPSTALVADGPYQFSRNPIYLGFAVTYLGLALALGSWLALALLVPCLLVVDRGVIAREERYLSAKFGASYDAYRARVRRWI
ncbi:MAG: isoprenylcysteine carboxylmethyltransferase family protein [Alphaproteobacteria bacterium]|nr:isoprenylcysteine carboxylmethyltransferase family protein [Alphaproteobacteria bacterium]MBU1525936.1 isoprenylcysteine carboxylmethyltransferase family protein [Alphaproteobacteria bacterium]MBU2116188.1 isoprenylcysteine carboxylmethyltransferase family protein [Alphaproteobacteria bacterium]MBU2351615.1 isoprenylcysteine carboxylmethyltransferase family protein [Alphaproteobacteria bacterium]MBU2383790.1 isoprenylcysteine carboxylmethyltransferase family protein [Alphaproteobacteria bact